MRALLVLCAGNKSLHGLPVYLCTYPDGKLLAEKCIEGIFPESYTRIYYVIKKEDGDRYEAERRLKEGPGCRYPIEVICLEKKTNGPAETVYEAIKQAGITGAFAARDCLNGIRIREPGQGNYIAGLDLTTFDGDVAKLKTKSFIIKNEQSQILDIIEKRFRSDIISVGLYGFADTADYCEAYESLNDRNYPIDRLYVSHMISYLIGFKQRVFHCLLSDTHEDWGYEDSWDRLLKQLEQKGCVSRQDLKKLMMVDLDGTLVDTSRVNFLSYQEALGEHGISLDYEYYRNYCNGRHYTDFLPELLKGREDVMEEVHRKKQMLYPGNLSKARVNTALTDLMRLSRPEYQTALVTTASRANVDQLLKSFGMEDLFDHVITQEDVTKRKPDPEAFLLAMEKSGCRPENCVIFEDSEEGLKAAETIGVNTMMVKGYR